MSGSQSKTQEIYSSGMSKVYHDRDQKCLMSPITDLQQLQTTDT